MKWLPPPTLVLLGCCLFCLLGAALAQLGDPYKILGLQRSATPAQIRKSYLKLVKEWHPDKSADPSAQTRFVEIKQAYELLSDPDRRFKYDQKGITEEQLHNREYYHYTPTPTPFEELFQNGHFNFQENDITFFHKLSITTR